jgi:hypothetical protein
MKKQIPIQTIHLIINNETVDCTVRPFDCRPDC